jgi:cytochrome c oxidase subunit III
MSSNEASSEDQQSRLFDSQKLLEIVEGKAKGLPQDARAMQGVWLFLISLGIFFFASIFLYVVYVAMRVSTDAGLRTHTFYLPRSFVPSTILLILVSGSLELALRAARGDRNDEVKWATTGALLLGLLFMVIQAEGMYQLIHAASEVATARNSAYALTFFLAFVHALHVVGGLIGLVSTSIQASKDKYDHERNFGLRFCTLYWHFLDIVWVFLVGSFIVTTLLMNHPK